MGTGIDNDSRHDLPVTGSINALNGTLELDPLDKESQTIQILGTWSGTLVFEASNNDTDWFSITAVNVLDKSLISSTVSNGNFIVLSAGYSKTRIRASAWTSGTANIANEGGSTSQATLAIQSNPDSLQGTMRMNDSTGNNILSTTDKEIYSKVSPEPLFDILPKRASLANVVGGSEDLNVNGSTTPQIFRFAPGAGEICFLTALITMLADAGNTSYSNFGSGTALTNGVLIEVRSKGILHTIANIRTNADLTLIFSGGGAESSSGLLGTGNWLNEADLYSGVIGFFAPVILQNSTSDYIQVTVRDNLSTVDIFKMFYSVFKRNP